MDLSGFEVEAQAATAEDLATEAGRWFVDVFGVVPRMAAYVEDLASATADLSSKAVATSPLVPDDEEGIAIGVRIAGPAGLTFDVIQPTPAGHHESRISAFIEAAADLDGPPTDDVADAVEAIVADAWRAIEARLEGVAHDKVLATQLLVGQRSRAAAPDDPDFWRRSAASTLLSWFVGRGASG